MHEPGRGHPVHGLHVAVVADVGERVRQVLQVVEEQVREHRVLRAVQHRDGVVGRRSLAVGGEPVADDVGRHALGQVLPRRGHVARPGVMDPDLPGRHVGVVVVVDVHVGELGELEQRLPGHGDLSGISGVEVVDAVLHQRQAGRLPVVVQDRDLARVLGLPGERVSVRPRCRIVGDVILTPGDSRRVDRVRHRVLPALVVEGVGVLAPVLPDVRDVAVVQRLDHLLGDALADHVVGDAHEHVEVDLAAAELG